MGDIGRPGRTGATRRLVLGGVLGTAGSSVWMRASGQEATPDQEAETFLFVQAATTGSARPVAGDARSFELALSHESGQTLAFSDRPERLATVIETSGFTAALAGLLTDPPNAALVFAAPDGSDERVAVLELTHPTYDEASGTVHYQVRLIDPASESSTLGVDGAEPVVDGLPATFGISTLFIDNVLELYNNTRVAQKFNFFQNP